MSYIALARKWRPRTFSQLVGQDHINKALINSLKQQRLHHAYLFTGTRGVGKTSVARLLAKALNCEQGISAEPCLQCDACLAIEQGRFIDLIEIDGASRTRVEDTRELLENVQYAPTSGRFKIYLIDEVHMLSQHSFNALLKTLEEPPAHVKFLLATTDPQKLPITVLSRCLQFSLKHIPADMISAHLEQILNQERILFEKQALELLAKAAKGSMRDGLSLLDQAIAGIDDQLRAQDVKNILGYTQQDYALQLLHALAALDPAQLILISRQIATEGGHFQYVVDELLGYLHQISIVQSIPNNNPLLTPDAEVFDLSTQFSPEDVQLYYQIGIKSIEDMQLAPSIAIGFEMLLLRMYTFRPAPQQAMPTLAYQVNTLQSHANTTPTASAVQVGLSSDEYVLDEEDLPEAIDSDEPLTKLIMAQESSNLLPNIQSVVVEPDPKALGAVATPIITPITEAVAPEIPVENTNWHTILPHLALTGLARNAAENAELHSINDSVVVLRVEKGHLSLFTTAVIIRIEQGLANYYKKVVKLKIDTNDKLFASPAQLRKQVQTKVQAEAEIALQNDPFFQQLQQEFSAELVKNSIVSLEDEL